MQAGTKEMWVSAIESVVGQRGDLSHAQAGGSSREWEGSPEFVPIAGGGLVSGRCSAAAKEVA